MKTSLTILLIVASTMLQAQIEKGTTAITGALAYNSTKIESSGFESDNDFFSVNLQAGNFIKESLALGLALGYSKAQNNDLFAIGPFIRKYMMTDDKFGWFIQGGLGYAFGNNSVGGTETDITVISGVVSPGIVFFPSEKIGIELSLNGLSYSRQKQTVGSQEIIVKDVDLNLNPLDFTVGASFYFGR